MNTNDIISLPARLSLHGRVTSVTYTLDQIPVLKTVIPNQVKEALDLNPCEHLGWKIITRADQETVIILYKEDPRK